jgi:uncharacterized membrane protein YhaH (DUF805 family)
VGSVVGSLIGALVYVSLTNGMNLMGTGSDAQNIVKGIVLAGAVIFDVATRSGSTKSLSKILFSFKGRINRQDYWLGLILAAGLELILALTMNFFLYLAGSISPELGKFLTQSGVFMALYVLVVFVPVLWMHFAIAVKRWHDLALPGWWAVLNILLIPTIILGFIKGKEGGDQAK